MACGILVPWPRVEPIPLHWKLGVLTTEPPGKSLRDIFCPWFFQFRQQFVFKVSISCPLTLNFTTLSCPSPWFWTLMFINISSTLHYHTAAAAAKSSQSCPTLCDPTDGSPPGSPVPGILQARTLEWVAISFSSAWEWEVKVRSLRRVWLLATPWTAAHQAPLSVGFSSQEDWSGCHCLLQSHSNPSILAPSFCNSQNLSPRHCSRPSCVPRMSI